MIAISWTPSSWFTGANAPLCLPPVEPRSLSSCCAGNDEEEADDYITLANLANQQLDALKSQVEAPSEEMQPLERLCWQWWYRRAERAPLASSVSWKWNPTRCPLLLRFVCLLHSTLPSLSNATDTVDTFFLRGVFRTASCTDAIRLIQE